MLFLLFLSTAYHRPHSVFFLFHFIWFIPIVGIFQVTFIIWWTLVAGLWLQAIYCSTEIGQWSLGFGSYICIWNIPRENVHAFVGSAFYRHQKQHVHFRLGYFIISFQFALKKKVSFFFFFFFISLRRDNWSWHQYCQSFASSCICMSFCKYASTSQTSGLKFLKRSLWIYSSDNELVFQSKCFYVFPTTIHYHRLAFTRSHFIYLGISQSNKPNFVCFRLDSTVPFLSARNTRNANPGQLVALSQMDYILNS